MASYDISKLECVRPNPDGTKQARCPICFAQKGMDKKGNHLKIWQNGGFNCVVDQSPHHVAAIRSFLRGNGIDDVEYIDIQPKLTAETIYPEDSLKGLLQDFSYWAGRGASKEVLMKLECGLAPQGEKGKLAARSIFPCRDFEERIVGFAGRLVVSNSFAPKWKILGKKNNFLFPRYKLSKESIERSSQVILVEGIGCVIALAQAGIWNTLCLFGLNISDKQVGFLIGQGVKKIVIATNNEKSGIGNQAAEKIKKKLSPFFDSDNISTHLPLKKDFMEMTQEEISQWKGSL